MAHSLLQPPDRAAILDRVERLRPASARQWGLMQPAQMLRHVAEALRMAHGDRKLAPVNKPLFRDRLVKFLIINVVPFPKEAPTAPELRVTEPAEFEAERTRVRALVHRFESVPSTGAGPEHPLFGPLTWPEWGAIQYKHIDHHLRQFGV